MNATTKENHMISLCPADTLNEVTTRLEMLKAMVDSDEDVMLNPKAQHGIYATLKDCIDALNYEAEHVQYKRKEPEQTATTEAA